MKFKSLGLFVSLMLGVAMCQPAPSPATVSNTVTQTQTGLGDGVTTNFTITFDFRSPAQIVVTEYDTSTVPPTITTIPYGSGPGNFTLSGPAPGTTVVMGTAPTTTQYLIISRDIPLVQPVVFNPASIFPYKGVSNQLDLMTLQLQDIGQQVTQIASGSTIAPVSASTIYIQPAVSGSFNFVGTGASSAGLTSLIFFPGISYDISSETFNSTNFDGNLTGNVTGNADTATALASLPSACTAPQFATGIDANGNAVCSAPLPTPSPSGKYLEAVGTGYALANPVPYPVPSPSGSGCVQASGGSGYVLGACGSGGGGTGTVTSFSFSNANGFTGSVSNSTTTPALTLSTNLTGLIKGNGTALSAASAGTDYVTPTGNITGSAGSLTQSITSGLPVVGNGTGITAGTKSGNTTAFVTGSGTLTGVGCGEFDSSGNLTNTGSACGSASGGIIAPPSVQSFLSGSGTYNKNYTFIVSSANATVGATYTNNSITYTVYATVASSLRVVMSGSGAPTSSGTLTKTGGTGDSTITFSQVIAPLYIQVEMVGGGGGGAGAGSGSGSGGNGGATTFGTSLLTCNGGTGATGGNVSGNAAGGTATGNGNGIALTGGSGGSENSVAGNAMSAMGGSNPFGGGGAATAPNTTGLAGIANTGGGGAGGGTGTGTASASGGGAGGYLKNIITAPLSSYSYGVGAGGAGGTIGTAGTVGGAGGSGVVIVTEYYQ